MEINVHDDKKLVDIWLTKEERDNQKIREQMKPLCRGFSEKDYTVAVFLSGDRELVEETSALLRCNRRRIAELEVRQGKEPAVVESGPLGFTMTM